MVLIFILFSTASENTPWGLFFFPIISMEVLQSLLKTFFTDHATMEYSHIAIRVLSYSKISILSRMPNFCDSMLYQRIHTTCVHGSAQNMYTFLNSFLFAYNFKNTFADLFWPVYACIEITQAGSVHRTEYGNVSSSETSITTLILLYFNSR